MTRQSQNHETQSLARHVATDHTHIRTIGTSIMHIRSIGNGRDAHVCWWKKSHNELLRTGIHFSKTTTKWNA